MILDTVLLALNHVVTYGADSVENLNNSIKNLTTLRKAVLAAEKESEDDAKDE